MKSAEAPQTVAVSTEAPQLAAASTQAPQNSQAPQSAPAAEGKALLTEAQRHMLKEFLDEAAELSNRFAPEHLSIPDASLLPGIRYAGMETMVLCMR